MPDKIETELKFVVRDPAGLRERLAALGVVRGALVHQRDIRLDGDGNPLAARYSILRVRQNGDLPGCVVTFKSPPAQGDPAFKQTREVEFTASDRGAVLALLDGLGYRPIWAYEKRRESWHWRDLEIALDETPIGAFAELEGTEDQIREMAGLLGWRIEEGITLNYRQLHERVRAALGLDIADLTFEAYRGVAVDPALFDGLSNQQGQ